MQLNNFNSKSLSVFFALTLSAFSKAESIPIKEGVNYFSARESITNTGWKPIPTYTKFESGEFENEFGEALTYKQNKFIEIESCSGTGEQYCIFNYKKNDECLRVVTQGVYDPKTNSPVVINWKTVDCNSLVTK